MLKTRIATAIGLLAVLLPSLFLLTQVQWALLMAAATAIAAWEWGGLVQWARGKRVAYGIALGLLAVGLTVGRPQLVEVTQTDEAIALYLPALAFWLLVVPLWLRFKWPGRVGGAIVGLLVLLPAWLAIVQLRVLGPGVLLAILAVVWLADIAAYFAGKTWGRHKLAPTVSPGKTWEGAIGAGIAVMLYGLALRHGLFGGEGSLLVWLPGLVLVTAVSILGDLFESLLKRQAGLKDSSTILPGHGGVLDRIDSLTSTLPTVACLWLLSGRAGG